MSTKKALLVGIDDYKVAPLQGCVADATALAERLRTNADGSANYDDVCLTDAYTLTRAGLLDRLEQLFSNVRNCEVLFYFSGHGRTTKFGAELVTADLDGVSMADLLTVANRSEAKHVTIILDCCFSGETGDLPGLQTGQIAESFRRAISTLSEEVTILTASRATEVSRERDGHGVFTRLILDGLDGGATDHLGNVTALSVYAYASRALGAWEQRPMLKTHLAEPPVLRVGPPWLDSKLLRDLPEYFDTADARVTMTPAHEGDGRPIPLGTGTVEQQAYDYFKRLRNAGLVATDNDEDHYWVAMHSHDVYLTPLGKYFWDLASRKRL